MAESPVNLEELVASERGRVLRLCSSRISDPLAAEDVTQEIFVKFAEKIANDTESIREPKAWLTRVAENACADYGRRLVKRRKGRRPNQKKTIESAGEKPARDAILLYESELPAGAQISSNDDANLDPFTKAIDQATMDQARNVDYCGHDDYDELSLDQIQLVGRLKRPERLALLACGPWNLDEPTASMFLDSKLAKKVVSERLKWPKGVPMVEASRIFNVKGGTLSSQMSRATAKLRSVLYRLASSRPTRLEQTGRDEARVKVEEWVTESIVNHSPATTLNFASQAFARIVIKEPTSLVPGWAGTPPRAGTNLPTRVFPRVDQREALRRISKQCGSYFKGCKNCGDVEYAGKCKRCGTIIHRRRQMKTAGCTSPRCNELRPRVKLKKYYLSGYSVRKAHTPQTSGWTYWCYECGAKDENCWAGFVPTRGLGSAASVRNTRCLRILQLLEVAERPEDMEIAGLRFHSLQGNPKRWSVCSTPNYRISFGWLREKVLDAGFEDYHQGRTEFMERTTTQRPVHPGAIIKKDILPSLKLSVTAASKALGMSSKTLGEILAKRKPLSAITCLKVSRLFGSSPEFWMRLQAAYDLKKAQQNKKVMARVERIEPVKHPVEEFSA